MHQNRPPASSRNCLGISAPILFPLPPATITTYNCIYQWPLRLIIPFLPSSTPDPYLPHELTPLGGLGVALPWGAGVLADYSLVYKNLFMLLFGVFTNSSGCILYLLTAIKSGSLSLTSFLVWSSMEASCSSEILSLFIIS